MVFINILLAHTFYTFLKLYFLKFKDSYYTISYEELWNISIQHIKRTRKK